MANVEDWLKTIPIDDYSKVLDIIDRSLPNFTTPTIRLKLLKRKFQYERKYLQLLRTKSVLTVEETSKLHLLQISYFATMTEMVHLENLADAFDQKKKYFKELVD